MTGAKGCSVAQEARNVRMAWLIFSSTCFGISADLSLEYQHHLTRRCSIENCHLLRYSYWAKAVCLICGDTLHISSRFEGSLENHAQACLCQHHQGTLAAAASYVCWCAAGIDSQLLLSQILKANVKDFCIQRAAVCQAPGAAMQTPYHVFGWI